MKVNSTGKVFHADHICNILLYCFLSVSVDVQNGINSCFGGGGFVSCSSLILVWRRSIETTALGSTYPTERTRTWLAQLATPPLMHIWGSSRGTHSWSSETSERNADTFNYLPGLNIGICKKKKKASPNQNCPNQIKSRFQKVFFIYI